MLRASITLKKRLCWSTQIILKKNSLHSCTLVYSTRRNVCRRNFVEPNLTDMVDPVDLSPRPIYFPHEILSKSHPSSMSRTKCPGLNVPDKMPWTKHASIFLEQKCHRKIVGLHFNGLMKMMILKLNTRDTYNKRLLSIWRIDETNASSAAIEAGSCKMILAK